MKSRWLLYTIVVGLIPFGVRSLIYLLFKDSTVDYLFNNIDFIVFGLVLSLANINELEDRTIYNFRWKMRARGGSIVLICFFTTLLTILLLHELNNQLTLDIGRLKYVTLSMSAITLLFSYSIYFRLKRLA